MIYAEHLRKEFQKIVKEPGLKGSFKALFKPKKETVVAADDISFHVPKEKYSVLSVLMVRENRQ